MFDIGFAEILFVAVVALLVLGPEKLPTAVKTVGMWVGRIRRTVSSIQSEISEELRLEELKRTSAISKENLDKELREMMQPYDASTESDTNKDDTNKAASEPTVEPSSSGSDEPTPKPAEK